MGSNDTVIADCSATERRCLCDLPVWLRKSQIRFGMRNSVKKVVDDLIRMTIYSNCSAPVTGRVLMKKIVTWYIGLVKVVFYIVRMKPRSPLQVTATQKELTSNEKAH